MCSGTLTLTSIIFPTGVYSCMHKMMSLFSLYVKINCIIVEYKVTAKSHHMGYGDGHVP